MPAGIAHKIGVYDSRERPATFKLINMQLIALSFFLALFAAIYFAPLYLVIKDARDYRRKQARYPSAVDLDEHENEISK